MNVIYALIFYPLAASIFIFFVRNDGVRNAAVKVSAFVVALLTLCVTVKYFRNGIIFTPSHVEIIDYLMMGVEILIAAYVIIVGFKNKKYIVSLFACIQTPLILWFELTR